jgi:uncharacterized lipoprotein YajG
MTRVERLARLLGLAVGVVLAAACAPPRATVEREPGAASLAALARTGVNLNWLLTGEGERQARSGVVE